MPFTKAGILTTLGSFKAEKEGCSAEAPKIVETLVLGFTIAIGGSKRCKTVDEAVLTIETFFSAHDLVLAWPMFDWKAMNVPAIHSLFIYTIKPELKGFTLFPRDPPANEGESLSAFAWLDEPEIRRRLGDAIKHQEGFFVDVSRIIPV